MSEMTDRFRILKFITNCDYFVFALVLCNGHIVRRPYTNDQNDQNTHVLVSHATFE